MRLAALTVKMAGCMLIYSQSCCLSHFMLLGPCHSVNLDLDAHTASPLYRAEQLEWVYLQPFVCWYRLSKVGHPLCERSLVSLALVSVLKVV